MVARPPVLVVGLGGSLGPNSISLSALKVALQGAADSGFDSELLDLRELDLPMYRPDVEVPPAEVMHMAERVYAAQGIVWSSPMYHGSISGAFKNAIDWLQVLARRDPPYLADKVVGLIATAGGAQGLQAVNTMEFIVRSLRGLAIPLVVPVARARDAVDRRGEVSDPAVNQQLRTLGAEVARVAATFAHGAPLQKECERARRVVEAASA